MAVSLAVLLLPACGQTPQAGVTSPQRIIAVAPNVVEILFELGLEHHVVAVGDHCVWPPEVAGKPRIGGLLDPRLETIASLEPDLAILLPSEQQLVTSLERLGVEVLVTPVESLLDVESAIDAIAARTGMQAKGAELVERLRSSLAPREMAEGPEVLLVVGREPGNLADIYVAAGGTFLDELLGRLGGSNIVADSPVRYPQVGLEEIATRGPKVIVELQPEVLDDTRRARLIDDWKRDLPVAEVCVAVVEGDHVLVPGPRVVDLYDDLAKALISCEGER